MDIAKEFFACLALKHARRIGPRTHKAILDAYPTAYDAVRDAANWHGRKLVRADQLKAFLEETWRPNAEFEYRSARLRGMRVLCWGDERYPEKLREIPDPPLALYYAGDLSLAANPSLAVVGARLCTPYGLRLARSISEDLSAMGLTVVSGLARGIDREAHQGGLAGVGSSIAVLGAGLDSDYPAENRDVRRALEERGLVLSEYAPGTIPEKNNFPYRNRIISGLSLGVLVAEAAGRSGSLITARLAGEQGREVFALPGPVDRPTSEGCHALLKQGATLVRDAEEILQELSLPIDREIAAARAKKAREPLPADGQAKARAADGAEAGRQPGTAVGHTALHTASQAAAQPGPEAIAKPAPPRPQPPMESLDPDEDSVLGRLGREERTHIDALCRALDWESQRVSRALLMLEMKGLAKQWPGMTYTLT
jgi:DNA processing protein